MIGASKLLRGGGCHFQRLFHNIVSVANLLSAWKEFRKGKRKKHDVAEFEFYLEDNLFKMNEELEKQIFVFDEYEPFIVNDPKRREIHKASVRDRVLNQAIFRVLYPVFNKSFIYDSFSSRVGKGIHIGVNRLFNASQKVTENWREGGYALKCDIRNFFDSVDHTVLFELIKRKIKDEKTLDLISRIINGFEKTENKGIPLGNVTSQLFANIYLNELDRFVKHTLKVKYYFRYADDFVLLEKDEDTLKEYKYKIEEFLERNLLLCLHKDKVFIRKIQQGVDFLGYVVLPHTIILRTKTKKRILKKIFAKKTENDSEIFFKTLDSYLGVLKHCKSRQIKEELFNSLL